MIDVEELERKSRIISNHLNSVLNDIRQIVPEEYFNFDDWYFAGGCVYSLWNDREVKDYDIFCKNKTAASKIRKYFRAHKDLTDIITKNAISVKKYQFVIRNIGLPEVEVAKFDFKHNMFYYDKGKLHNMVDWKYLSSNKLEFNTERARDILNIMTRIPKFVERGMEISQAEMLNILELGTRPTKIFKERKMIKNRQSGKYSAS